MRRHWRWLAASLLLAAPAGAAVVRDQNVVLEVQPDGSLRERVAWTVLVQSARDLDRWSPYAIALDQNRRLLRLEGSAQLPGGKVIPVKRKRRDRSGVAGDGILHASQEVELVDFSSVPDGSLLTLEYEIEERPYFPSGSLALGGEDAVERLQVEVRASGLRVRLAGTLPELRLEERAGVATVSGSIPAQREVELAPVEHGPVLRYSWATASDWPAVGGWYRDLVAPVPRGSAAVRSLATRLAPGPDRRQTVERLLTFVQREVRYVAVEVGIGGYRPGVPEEVLARRWGDCKDKALLLVDLLAAVGIEGRVALVRASDAGDIDAAFPAPDQFNHMVVALPAATLAPGVAAPPAASGWLFVDPTQSRGGLDWLHPWLAGHQALVITPAGGELVAVPLDPLAEKKLLTLELALDREGGAAGKARLELRGAAASELTRHTETERPEIVVAAAQLQLAEMLPGATLSQVAVETTGESPPRGHIDGEVGLPSLVGGSGGQYSLLPPSTPATPTPGLLEQRTQPIVLSPGVIENEWRIAVPWDNCRLEPAAASFEGALGSFRQEATMTGTTLSLRRHTELRAWQVLPEQFGELRSLALAEHRALKRRLRLTCPSS